MKCYCLLNNTSFNNRAKPWWFCFAHSNHCAHKLLGWSCDLVYHNIIFTFIGQY